MEAARHLSALVLATLSLLLPSAAAEQEDTAAAGSTVLLTYQQAVATKTLLVEELDRASGGQVSRLQAALSEVPVPDCFTPNPPFICFTTSSTLEQIARSKAACLEGDGGSSFPVVDVRVPTGDCLPMLAGIPGAIMDDLDRVGDGAFTVQVPRNAYQLIA